MPHVLDKRESLVSFAKTFKNVRYTPQVIHDRVKKYIELKTGLTKEYYDL